MSGRRRPQGHPARVGRPRGVVPAGPYRLGVGVDQAVALALVAVRDADTLAEVASDDVSRALVEGYRARFAGGTRDQLVGTIGQVVLEHVWLETALLGRLVAATGRPAEEWLAEVTQVARSVDDAEEAAHG